MEFTGAIREAKKGTAELVVLAFLDDEPRHGYELAQLIEERSGGALTFNFASLYATLYKLEERKWIQGRWVEKAGQRRRRYYKITERRPRGAGRAAEGMAAILPTDSRSGGSALCLIASCATGNRWFANARIVNGASCRSKSSTSSRVIWPICMPQRCAAAAPNTRPGRPRSTR